MTNSRDYVTRRPLSLTNFLALLTTHTDWRVTTSGAENVIISDGENCASAQKYGERICVSPYRLSRITDLVELFNLVLLHDGGNA